MSAVVTLPKTPSFQSLSSRTWILASFYVAVILAIPFWLKTTTIERLPLPRQDVVAWEQKLPCPIRIPHSITLILPQGVVNEADEFAVAEGVRWGLRVAGDGIVEVSKPSQHYASEGSKADGGAEETEEANLGSQHNTKDYETPLKHAACVDFSVRIGHQGEHKAVPSDPYYEITFEQSSTTTPHSRSMTSGRFFTLALPEALKSGHSYDSTEISSILSSYLSRLLQLPYTPLYYPSEASVPTLQDHNITPAEREGILQAIDDSEEDRRKIPYTRNLRLIFSLINEDVSASGDGDGRGRRASAGIRGWDAFEVEQVLAKKFDALLKALSHTQKIEKEMQSIWFAPLQFEPKVLEIKEQVKVNDTSENRFAALMDYAIDESDSLPASSTEETSLDIPAQYKIEKIHIIDWEDLKIFVNSGEWSLTSGTVSSPLAISMADGVPDDITTLYEQNERTLHFVLYVPKPSHRPLKIAGDAQATTVSQAKGWLIPQWGGVSILNLGYEEYELGNKQGPNDAIIDSLTAYELDQVFTTFQKQLTSLVGLKEIDLIGIDEKVTLAMQLDALTRQRIVMSARESVKTLGSIVRLVDKIKNLGVGKAVRDDVAKALAFLESAASLLRTTDFDKNTVLENVEPLQPFQSLLKLSHSSEMLSSKAFFNPNMLGQLYFPDEHKYAVYTPLFGPLAVPLLVAGLRLLKEKRRSKKVIVLK